jgi:type VI protein secretion system component VasF
MSAEQGLGVRLLTEIYNVMWRLRDDARQETVKQGRLATARRAMNEHRVCITDSTLHALQYHVIKMIGTTHSLLPDGRLSTAVRKRRAFHS